MSKPLHGISVLDFSHLLPGELCATILSDLGADVLRIEPLETPLGQMIPPVVEGESLFFWSMHRNQKRMALNLKSEQAVKIIEELVPKYDVIVENFRPGVMERLGIGYDHLKKFNEKLVYCSISAYGQDVSWSQRPGHDLNFVAEAGILARNCRPGEMPVLPSVLISDYTVAIYSALGVASALFQRETTGQGQQLDVSMFEAALSTVSILATALLYDHDKSKNYSYPLDPPNYCLYECSDNRYLAVAALEPQFWNKFCLTIGLPDYAKKRIVSADKEAYEKIAAIIRQKSLSEWRDLFANADCCVSPVNTIQEALDMAPIKERATVVNITHPKLGMISQLATPLFNAKDKTSVASTDRVQQTSEILANLGYSEESICELADRKVILKTS